MNLDHIPFTYFQKRQCRVKEIDLCCDNRAGLLHHITMGHVVNLSGCARRRNGELVLLSLPNPDMDYCDLEENRMIQSIVYEYRTGHIVASIRCKESEHPEYKALWICKSSAVSKQ